MEEEVLVAHWKENFHVLETLWRDEAWAKIVSAVETVGNKTIKQCKSKIDKLKEKYKEAKDLNGETGAAGANINKSPFFDIFDEMLREYVMKMPHVKQVGVSSYNLSMKFTTSTASSTSSISTPNPSKSNTSTTVTRSDVDAFLMKGKHATKNNQNNKKNELFEFLKEDRKVSQEFLQKLADQRLQNAREAAEKERNFWKDIFKK